MWPARSPHPVVKPRSPQPLPIHQLTVADNFRLAAYHQSMAASTHLPAKSPSRTRPIQRAHIERTHPPQNIFLFLRFFAGNFVSCEMRGSGWCHSHIAVQIPLPHQPEQLVVQVECRPRQLRQLRARHRDIADVRRRQQPAPQQQPTVEAPVMGPGGLGGYNRYGKTI